MAEARAKEGTREVTTRCRTHMRHAHLARRVNLSHLPPLAASGKSVAFFRASRAHTEGRFAIVTKRGAGYDGCAGSARRAPPTHTAKTRGPDLPTLGSSLE